MNDDKVEAYKEAYETWQKHLTAVHELLLEHKRMDPLHIKGLLNRESRSKRKYDLARLRLLGIEEDAEPSDDDEDDEA